jgi:hypothetical protein
VQAHSRKNEDEAYTEREGGEHQRSAGRHVTESDREADQGGRPHDPKDKADV